MDKRTQQQLDRVAAGRCARCGRTQDRVGRTCQRCVDETNARNRQRYRPGQQAAEWTMAMLARGTALEQRGVL